MAHETEFWRHKRHVPVTSWMAVMTLVVVVLFVSGGGQLFVDGDSIFFRMPYLDFSGSGSFPGVSFSG